MRKSPILIGAAALMFAAGAPVLAQDASAADQTAATADAAPPQPTEKEAKTLDRCKKMTTQERAQSSKCTDLMKKFGISEQQGNDFMRQQALGH